MNLWKMVYIINILVSVTNCLKGHFSCSERVNLGYTTRMSTRYHGLQSSDAVLGTQACMRACQGHPDCKAITWHPNRYQGCFFCTSTTPRAQRGWWWGLGECPQPAPGFTGCFSSFQDFISIGHMEETAWSQSPLMHKTACVEACRGQDAIYAIFTESAGNNQKELNIYFRAWFTLRI